MPLDFGVEIECLIPGQRDFVAAVGRGVAEDLLSAGVPCGYAGYSHARTGSWKVVTDASLSPPPGFVGLEVVSPPMRDENVPQIDTVCGKLKDLGAKVNRSCGLHVHIGARQLAFPALKRLAYLFVEHEEVIDSLLPTSRRGNGNQYCRSLKSNVKFDLLQRARDVTQIAGAFASSSRYVKLNFNSFWKHGTVEFRQHSGTIDSIKITRWIGFCQKLVDVATLEQDAAIAVASLESTNAALARRIARARQLKLIYEAVARPNGATSVEVQQLLGRRTPPALASDLSRLGVDFHTDGRRGGHVVYKLSPNNVSSPATLASLLNKLGMEGDESQFWRDRQAMLSGIGLPSDLAE